MLGVLYGIGVGPGDPELMTLKAVNVIKACDVIAVPDSSFSDMKGSVALQIASQAVPELIAKPLLKLSMPMTKDKILLEESHLKAVAELIELLKSGKKIAFLTLGDPSIYSTFSYVQKPILQEGYTVETIAGVPSFCAAAAKLGVSLVERGEALHVIPASYNAVDSGLSLDGSKVLMKTGNSIAKVKELLSNKGLLECAQMVSRCGMEGETIFYSMKNVNENTDYFSIIIVK